MGLEPQQAVAGAAWRVVQLRGVVLFEDSPPPNIDAKYTTYSMDTPVEQMPKSSSSIHTISPLRDRGGGSPGVEE